MLVCMCWCFLRFRHVLFFMGTPQRSSRVIHTIVNARKPVFSCYHVFGACKPSVARFFSPGKQIKYKVQTNYQPMEDILRCNKIVNAYKTFGTRKNSFYFGVKRPNRRGVIRCCMLCDDFTKYI